MRVLEKNSKGFNVLELLIVVVIIGIISAVAYPNFSSWKKEREARSSTVKIKNLIQGINAQVQRGLYAYVQVRIEALDDRLTITSKGMKMDTLATKINDAASDWNADATTRCDIDSTGYWDDDGSIDDRIEVAHIEVENVTTNFESGVGAVCFSKNAKWYSGAGNFISASGGDISVDNLFFICTRNDDFAKCDVDESSGVPQQDHDNLYLVEWSRFGNVTMEKWSKSKSDWVLQ